MGATLIVLLTVILPVAAQQPTDYVNPLIGTNGMGHPIQTPSPTT